MKTPPFLLSLCAAALVLPFSADAQDAKKYQLKLERPNKAGDRLQQEIHATLEKSQRALQGDKVVKSEASNIKATLTGTLEVVEVSAQGNIKKLNFKIAKFTTQAEGKTEEQPLKAGTVVTGSAGDGDKKKKFEANGKALEGATAEVLGELLTMRGGDKKQTSIDEVFGSKEPRAPGTEWKVDPKAWVDSLPDDMPFKLTPEEVSGKVKFPAVEKKDGVESCRLQMSVDMKPASFPGGPPSFKADKVVMSLSIDSLLPVDPSLPSPYDKADQRMEVNGTMDSPNGQVKLETSRRTVKERTSKLLK